MAKSSELESLQRDRKIAKAIADLTRMHDGLLSNVDVVKGMVEQNKAQLRAILNLPKGDKGDRGPIGPQGIPGRDGKDGKDGKDGFVPVKGKDYFTKEDKEEVLLSTLARIRMPKDGEDAVVDEEKLKESIIEKLREEDMLGVKKLSGEVSSYRNQLAMKQAGQHGGGDTVVAGTNISIVTNANGQKVISATGSGTGSVTDVSVVSANGFAGSVANSTTTPAITISTTVTGILKGNGTAISAAVANTDYQVPINLTTTGTSGAATFDGTTLNIPQYTGGSGGISRSIASVAVNTNAGAASSTDYVYLVSGTTTITMPTAVGNTNRYTIKRVGTDPVTIAFTGAETGDGSATLLLNVQYDSLDLISNNTNWNII